MTTHAPLRSQRTKAPSVSHVPGLREGDAPTSPLKDTRLEAVAFRVKAPVPRRPPHRSGRAGFPHPVPREPKASANGEPHRRHPVWRITLLSQPLLDVVHDPGFWKRQFAMDGLHKLLPAYVALVAASAQPVLPSSLGMLEDDFEPLERTPDSL